MRNLNKKKNIIIFFSVLILLVGYLILQNQFLNNEDMDEPELGINDNDDKIDEPELSVDNNRGRIYAGVGYLESILNNEERLKPVKDFSLMKVAYTAVEEITEPYRDQFKDLEGNVLPVTVFIRGEYLLNDGGGVSVSIIQDKTFENGGYIYNNRSSSLYPGSEELITDTSIFKYKNSYLIFEFFNRTEKQEDNLENINFIHDFMAVYKNHYIEYEAE